MTLLRAELPPTAGLPARWRDFAPPWQHDFAAQAAAWLGADWALLTSSGTAALWIALAALRTLAPQRRRVVLPAYTCPLVAEAVLRAGLTPRLCDTRPGHFDFDPGQLADCCDADTLAIVSTHLAGRVADVALARRLAASCGAFVIEDGAQAFGAQAKGADGAWRSLGLAGDIGVYSFSVGKGLTLYEGGLLLARDARVRNALGDAERSLRRHAPLLELRRCAELLGYAALYRPRTLGLVYGAPLRRALARGDVVAAVGDSPRRGIPLHRVGAFRQSAGARGLARYRAHLQAARSRAAALRAQLLALPGLHVLADADDQHGIWMFLLLHLPSAAARDRALAPLWGAGLGVTRLFAHALPDYPQLRGRIESPALPQARAFAACTLALGNSHWLRPQAVARVLAALRAALD